MSWSLSSIVDTESVCQPYLHKDNLGGQQAAGSIPTLTTRAPLVRLYHKCDPFPPPRLRSEGFSNDCGGPESEIHHSGGLGRLTSQMYARFNRHLHNLHVTIGGKIVSGSLVVTLRSRIMCALASQRITTPSGVLTLLACAFMCH